MLTSLWLQWRGPEWDGRDVASFCTFSFSGPACKPFRLLSPYPSLSEKYRKITTTIEAFRWKACIHGYLKRNPLPERPARGSRLERTTGTFTSFTGHANILTAATRLSLTLSQDYHSSLAVFICGSRWGSPTGRFPADWVHPPRLCKFFFVF